MNLALARHAMATRFEFVLCGEQGEFLRSVGEEALDEVERVERQLSYFRSDSDLTDVNRNAANRPVKVDPRFFQLLQQARELSKRTAGAFDPTVGPLLQLWGFRPKDDPSDRSSTDRPAPPTTGEIEETRSVCGFRNLELNEEDFTVRFLREGVALDLGGIGKGYALDRAAEIVRQAGIASALLHGGTSSIVAVGAPPQDSDWRIAIQNPLAGSERLGDAQLRDCALSISAQHGRTIRIGDKHYGHTIDPRTGYPVEGALLAALISPSATEAEAYSTALLVLSEEESGFGDIKGWLKVNRKDEQISVVTGGEGFMLN